MSGIGRTDNSELAALVTGDPVKADDLARLYGIKAWSHEQYGDLLASGEIDAVYVATPNFLHSRYAVPALEAGIHVLLEKPMAASVEEAEQIVAAQTTRGAKLMIAYRLHHEPGTVEMITRARGGEFGALRGFVSAFAQNVAEAKPMSRRRARGAGRIASMRSSSSAARLNISPTASSRIVTPKRMARKDCSTCACWPRSSGRS